MSTVVIQLKKSPVEETEYVFTLGDKPQQNTFEPMGIFHNVEEGNHKVSVSFKGKKLEGKVTVSPSDGDFDDSAISDGEAITVTL